MELIASISVIGWGLIIVAILCLWHLPNLLRGAGKSTFPEEAPPVGEPPVNVAPKDANL